MHHCRYFSQQWMEAMPPNMWNHFSYVGPCTNNHLEGYHRKLNLEFNRSHPSIYQLIGILQNHKVEYRVKVGLGILGSLVSAHYHELFFSCSGCCWQPASQAEHQVRADRYAHPQPVAAIHTTAFELCCALAFYNAI